MKGAKPVPAQHMMMGLLLSFGIRNSPLGLTKIGTVSVVMEEAEEKVFLSQLVATPRNVLLCNTVLSIENMNLKVERGLEGSAIVVVVEEDVVGSKFAIEK